MPYSSASEVMFHEEASVRTFTFTFVRVSVQWKHAEASNTTSCNCAETETVAKRYDTLRHRQRHRSVSARRFNWPHIAFSYWCRSTNSIASVKLIVHKFQAVAHVG